jgi:GNAT superfamily N-acetyltransferase
MQIRDLDQHDHETICWHREQMFRESEKADDLITQTTPHFAEWLLPHLIDKTYFGFLACEGEAVVGGIGMMVLEWPPHPSHPTASARGYVLNLYVEIDRRRRGFAGQLLQRAELEFSKRGIHFAVLHPTESARALYEKSGWRATNEMSKQIY